MSRMEIWMRFLPVIAFVIVAFTVFTRPLEPSWGVPLLTLEVALMVVSIRAWIPRQHGRNH